MKKVQLKINAATKRIVLGLAMAAMIGYSALSTAPASKRVASMAFVGFVATFKKKGIELTPEEETHFKAMDDVFAENLKGLVTGEELTEKLNAIKGSMSEEAVKLLIETANSELAEQQKAQAIAIDQLKSLGGNGSTKGKTLREQIKEALTSETVKAELEAMRSKQASAKGFEIVVKAAGAMTIAGTTAATTAETALSFPQPEFIPGLNDVARNRPFLVQLLNVMNTGKELIIYTEKYNPDGAAGWLGENEAAPEVDFDVRIGNSRAKLVSCFIEVSTQMLDDVDYMASEIEKELIYQEAIKIDTDLLTGDGVGDNLAGIDSFAGGYTLTSSQLSTTNPNNCDAIIACATQIAHDNFNPDIAVLNPIDYAQTTLLKGTTGYYIVNPNNEGNKWGKILVVESNQVPVGYTMVMDSSKTNLYRYKDLNISYGWVNDNFKKNMVTIMANQRLHFFIKNNDVNGFIYDTLANIKAALTLV